MDSRGERQASSVMVNTLDKAFMKGRTFGETVPTENAVLQPFFNCRLSLEETAT
jgi:hypothetical protein